MKLRLEGIDADMFVSYSEAEQNKRTKQGDDEDVLNEMQTLASPGVLLRGRDA